MDDDVCFEMALSVCWSSGRVLAIIKVLLLRKVCVLL